MKAKLSSKNQITIPKEAREFLGIAPGAGLRLFFHPDGGLVIRPTVPVAKLKGSLPKLDRVLSVEDINDAIRQGAIEAVCR